MFLGCRDQIPTQGTKGALVLSPQWARLFRAMMREKCTEGTEGAEGRGHGEGKGGER